MPQSTKIQVNFRSATEEYFPPAKRSEHRIGIYPMARDEVLLRWHRSQGDEESRFAAAALEKQLAAHWLEKAEDLKREHRFLAAIDACRTSLRFDTNTRAQSLLDEMIEKQRSVDVDWAEAVSLSDERRHSEAISVLKRLLSVKPELAKAHGKLGMLYAIEGQSEAAKEHLELVEKLDSNDAYGVGMLGWLAYLQGDAAAALEYLRRADEIEPQNARIQQQMGLALLKLGDAEAAASSFRRALEIEPQSLDAFDGLNSALRQQGRFAEALEVAHRAVTISQNHHPVALMTLAETLYELGRFREAEETAQRIDSSITDASSPSSTQLENRRRVLRSRLARRRK
jgi:tetratricopeptide (TPR) repeat protein